MRKWLLFALLTTMPVLAQPDNEIRDWFGIFELGFADVIGDAGDVADDGWDLSFGAIYWPKEWNVGLQTEFSFVDTELVDEIVELAEADDSKVEVWSLTTGMLWSRSIGGGVAFNLNAGGGAYRLDAKLTEPGLFIGPVCDPWLWYCFPGIIEGDVVVDSIDTTRFGYYLGAGFSFALGDSGLELLLEARYNRIETSTATEYIPFNIGLRF